MTKVVNRNHPMLLRNRTWWDRLWNTRSVNKLAGYIEEGYIPYGPTGNPLITVFKRTGPDTALPKEMNPDLKWVLICHNHKFIGLATPKHYGRDTVFRFACPFCTEADNVWVECSEIALTNHLQTLDKPYYCKDGIVIHTTGAWKRLRQRFANYTHRWTYVNGIPVRMDSNGQGTQMSKL